MNLRSYTIISTNCDCCSDYVAKSSLRWKFGPTCPSCRRVLGPMQWSDVATIRATSPDEALMKYKQEKHAQCEAEKAIRLAREAKNLENGV